MGNIFLDKNIAEINSCFISGTFSPVEIAKHCIDAYDKYNDKFYPWVCFDKEYLLMQSEEALKYIKKGNPLRKLEGIPIGIKDIFNTVDFPTQHGSPIWEGFTPGNDSRTVFNIKAQGALVPGKTATAEFAVHTLGSTLNPHDPTKTPGTSSSGSAVAVALGMVPCALGTQTAGSIVRPASFCGIYGCKPSFGLIPRTGMLKTTDSLDTIGYFVSRYEDLKRIFEVLRVRGPNYPKSFKAFNDPNRVHKPKNRPWRVAFVKTHTWQYAYDYTKHSIMKFLKRISSANDIEIVETELPEQMSNTHEIHATIYDKTLSYYFAEEDKRSELVSPIMKNLIRHGKEINTSEYLKALENQTGLCLLMDKFFDNHDILISISTAGEAPLRDVVEKPDPALMWTMTHLPIISAPVFVSPKGLPFGVQLVARRYNDYLLFNFSDHLRKLDLIPPGVNPLYKPY